MNNRTKRNAMKKIINFIEGFLVFSLLVFSAGAIGTFETRYSHDGIVTEINNNVITIEDTTGNLWDFTGEGFALGDKVHVTFDSQHTDNTRIDDKIVKIKKIK